MHTQIFKKLACLIFLTWGLFGPINLFADDTTESDVNAAYDYYSNVANESKNPKPPANQPANQNTSLPTPTGFGGMASNLMQPVSLLSGFLSGAAVVIGITCLFGGFVRYMQHRVNPLAHPISTVVTLFLLGLILLVLPLIYKLTESGVAASID